MHHKACLTPLDAVAYSPGDGSYQTFVLQGITVGVVMGGHIIFIPPPIYLCE